MSQKVDQRKGGLRCVGGEEVTGGEGRGGCSLFCYKTPALKAKPRLFATTSVMGARNTMNLGCRGGADMNDFFCNAFRLVHEG